MSAPECIPDKEERMVYHVLSSKPPHRYRVDLLSLGGATECSCKDFATRRGPAIERGEPLGTRSTLCRHGIIARRFFLNGLLQQMARDEQQQPTKRK